MTEMKTTEAAKPTTEAPVDAPPSYTPHPSSPAPMPSREAPAAATTSHVVPENVHVPQAPFSNDLNKIGPDPTNVICPRCHYGVQTLTKSRTGTQAG